MNKILLKIFFALHCYGKSHRVACVVCVCVCVCSLQIENLIKHTYIMMLTRLLIIAFNKNLFVFYRICHSAMSKFQSYAILFNIYYFKNPLMFHSYLLVVIIVLYRVYNHHGLWLIIF